MVVRWKFFDPILDQEFVFTFNPSEVSLPSYEKNITSRQTTASDGKAILFESQANVLEIGFNGVLFEESDYDWFLTWFNKKYQVKLTDDLGNEFWCYLTSFSSDRRRSFHHDWCMDYKAKAVIVDW